MPMSALSNSAPRPLVRAWARDDCGSSVIEFALALPMLLLMAAGFLDVGRAYSQATTLNKAVRAGAEFAARNEVPLSAAAQTQVENLIRTGTLDGSGGDLVPGFGAGGAVTVTLGSYDPGSGAVPVLHVTARVPYTPVLSGLAGLVGLGALSLEVSHEQAYVGT